MKWLFFAFVILSFNARADDGACDVRHGVLTVYNGPDNIVFEQAGDVDNVDQQATYVTFDFNYMPWSFNGESHVWFYQLLDYRFNNEHCTFSIVYDYDRLFHDDFEPEYDEGD